MVLNLSLTGDGYASVVSDDFLPYEFCAPSAALPPCPPSLRCGKPCMASTPTENDSQGIGTLPAFDFQPELCLEAGKFLSLVSFVESSAERECCSSLTEDWEKPVILKKGSAHWNEQACRSQSLTM